MLLKDLWLPHEPRFGFYVFRDSNTLVSFSIHAEFKPITFKRVIRTIGRKTLKQSFGAGVSEAVKIGRELGRIALSGDGKALRFRVAITSCEGEYLGQVKIPGTYPPGASVDINLQEVLAQLALPMNDYMAIVIMTRGRMDAYRSSPGSYSMTYFNDRIYSTYRTGGFARTLNEPNRKKHVGFRGINPKIVVNDRFVSSILLINHSSDPLYDETVAPKSVLLRADGATREASFGQIKPFGGLVRSVEDLFGKDVGEFLAPCGGKGTTITTCPGVTLASIHLMRARDGSSMSIEHSRPTQAYLLNGVS